jgi:hypothetical protein
MGQRQTAAATLRSVRSIRFPLQFNWNACFADLGRRMPGDGSADVTAGTSSYYPLVGSALTQE